MLSGDAFAPFVFGNFELVSVTGLKFHDWDRDGLRDAGEEGLANWVIELEGWTVDGDHVLMVDYTESDGSYSFEGLMAGDYTVRERLDLAPPGWSPTTPDVVPLDLTSGTAESVSFGNIVSGLILGYKFYDKNMDGYWDDETSPGWTDGSSIWTASPTAAKWSTGPQ